MLKRYIKCEYTYFPNSPTFFAVIFGGVLMITALSSQSFESVVYFVLGAVVFIGGSIGAIYWAREMTLGANVTTITMPISRSDYCRCKYVAIFVGQLYFSAIIILISVTITLVGLSFVRYSARAETMEKILLAALVSFSMVCLASCVNYILTPVRQLGKGLFMAGLLLCLGQAILLLVWGEAPIAFFRQLRIIIPPILVLVIPFSLVYAWRRGVYHFKTVKDLG